MKAQCKFGSICFFAVTLYVIALRETFESRLVWTHHKSMISHQLPSSERQQLGLKQKLNPNLCNVWQVTFILNQGWPPLLHTDSGGHVICTNLLRFQFHVIDTSNPLELYKKNKSFLHPITNLYCSATYGIAN